MKIPINPPKTVLLKDWNSFQAAAKNDLFATPPQIVVIETSKEYQDFQRRLQAQIRPFAVALLIPKN